MAFQLLFADDSATMHRVVQITLAREDAQIIAVNSGRDAVLRARQMRPDIAVLDVGMAEMDGYAACQALKDDPSTSHIPVLLLASSQEPIDAARAQDCGADGHLLKPFDTQNFIDTVKKLLATVHPAPSQAHPSAQAESAAPISTPWSPPPQAQPQPLPQTPPHAPPKAAPGYPNPLPRAASMPFAGTTTPMTAPPPPGPSLPAAQSAASTPAAAASAPTNWQVAPGASAGPVPRAAPAISATGHAPAPRSSVPLPIAAVPAATTKATSVRRPAAAENLAQVGRSIADAAAPAAVAAMPQAKGGGLATHELLAAAREILEKVAWEVVPAMAEALIKEHIDRLAKR